MYYESGALALEAPFKNNKQEGIVKMYDENGVLWMAIKYQNDKAVRGVCGNGRELTYTEIENWNNMLKEMKMVFYMQKYRLKIIN